MHLHPAYRRQRSRLWTMLLRGTRLSSLLATLSLLNGCVLAVATEIPQNDPPSATVSTDWEVIAPGLERRTYLPLPGNPLVQLIALRIDPSLYDLRVHYRPGEPLPLGDWQATLPDAVALVNANFFDRDNQVVGLLIADGVRYGETLRGRGGTLFVQDGQPGIQSHRVTPYGGEAYDQAVQAFPMLVTNGQASYTNSRDLDVARRTAAAVDEQGHVILLATTLLGIRLTDLSRFLAESDMNISAALNLDGGGSTMMSIIAPDSSEAPFLLRSFDPVPAVLAVYRKGN